jgi:proteasome lid subunit RPN8/RPN11
MEQNDRPLLARDQLARIIDHVQDGYPEEACGLLLQSGEAVTVAPCQNLANQLHADDPETFPRDARTFYAIDPAIIMRADRDGTLRGVYHSHCDLGDYFSREDRLQATMGMGEDAGPAWEGCKYLVVSVMNGVAVHATLWVYDDETRRYEASDSYTLTPQ